VISIYEILEDKNGFYYISYNKKHRIKTLENKNKKLLKHLQELKNYNIDNSYINEIKEKHFIKYNIITLNDKKYIQFG